MGVDVIAKSSKWRSRCSLLECLLLH